MDQNSSIKSGKHRYYANQALKGRYVVLRVDSPERQLVAEVVGQSAKAISIKGFYGGLLEFGDYLEIIGVETRAKWQQWYYQQGHTGAR